MTHVEPTILDTALALMAVRGFPREAEDLRRAILLLAAREVPDA